MSQAVEKLFGKSRQAGRNLHLQIDVKNFQSVKSDCVDPGQHEALPAGSSFPVAPAASGESVFGQPVVFGNLVRNVGQADVVVLFIELCAGFGSFVKTFAADDDDARF